PARPPTISSLSLHDALPIYVVPQDLDELVPVFPALLVPQADGMPDLVDHVAGAAAPPRRGVEAQMDPLLAPFAPHRRRATVARTDRKSTRLNSSHVKSSYAV